MIASLPMYDRPEVAALHDALWSDIRDSLRDNGVAAPQHLSRGGDLWDIWQSPDLVLGQTCNLPLRARLHPRVTLVANPDLGLADTPPGHYHSLFVTRSGAPQTLAEYRDARLAINDALSQSGWAAPHAAAAALGFGFARIVETGAHRASAAAIVAGAADIAAIDAHTWRLLLAHDGALTDRLQVIGRSAASPAPPYVTAFPDLAPLLRRALAGALARHGGALAIRGLVQLPLAAHLSLPLPPDPRAIAPETGGSATSATISTLQSHS